MSPLLAVENLEVAYHRTITAVQGINLTVNSGQIVAILGTNGAGKTTTLRAISGFLGIDDARVTEGAITFKGRRIDNRPPHEIARSGIVLVPERDKVFPNLTVAENLSAAIGPQRANRRRREESTFQLLPRLADLRGRLAGLLSGGERQMLAIATALMCQPELLLIVERRRRGALRRHRGDPRQRAAVVADLLPEVRRDQVLQLVAGPFDRQDRAAVVVEDLMVRLVQIRERLGITIVIVEQSAAVALQIADYGYVLENGRVVLDGDRTRLMAHGDIQEFYLGQTSGDRRSYRSVKQYRRSRRWYG